MPYEADKLPMRADAPAERESRGPMGQIGPFVQGADSRNAPAPGGEFAPEQEGAPMASPDEGSPFEAGFNAHAPHPALPSSPMSSMDTSGHPPRNNRGE